jgi:GT2 family glycosyltransferase
MSKVGLGLVTFNRPEYCRQALESLEANNWGGATLRLVYEDCSDSKYKLQYDTLERLYKDKCIFMRGTKNYGVAVAKNTLLTYMFEEQCDYLFTMEDDILMKNKNTCIYYQRYADMNKIQYMNFGLHGTMNHKDQPLFFQGLLCYPNCIGAFTLHTRECIELLGYYDDTFKNAWEHVEYCWRACEIGITTPFWYFIDYPKSYDLLEEIPGSIDNSSIRPRDDWNKNIQEGQQYWISKHGKFLPERPY